MASCYFFTGSSPGSAFGRTRQEEGGEGPRPPSLITRATPWVWRLSGVSSGSGLMGRSAGEPEEREPDDEELAVSIHRDVKELSQRQEKEGGCYFLSMRWFSLEEERVMQQSSVSISLSF